MIDPFQWEAEIADEFVEFKQRLWESSKGDPVRSRVMLRTFAKQIASTLPPPPKAPDPWEPPPED